VPSFTSLFTSLTGAGFFFEKNSRHATYNFNQDARSLYRNQPRFPFEYYININFNKVDQAAQFYNNFFQNTDNIAPLVKSVEMPSMKIETTPLNQYNRKRLSQTKIAFEPIKMVFHDVADGKTLKFWEMYYRYYFGDGTEPGKNDSKSSQQKNKSYSVESLIKNITPAINPALASLPASIKNMFQSNAPSGANSSTNTNGEKSKLENIVSDTLDSHIFGFNLPQVQNVRSLIQSIDIFQVHGGRFNQVRLVNPRIAAFTHDTLNYAAGDKTLELTFAFEYEYAYYTIQNLQLGGQESNNTSSMEPFTHGQFLELPSLAFNATLNDFIESNNPLLNSDNPILQQIGKNVQSTIGSVTGAFASNAVHSATSAIAGALDGSVKMNPTPYVSPNVPKVTARSFASTAPKATGMYKDVNRTGGNPGG
jgi:hypothetical protein